MRKRVLIAESSEITVKAAKTVLRQNGFEIIAVSSGDKAFQVLEHSKPHLLIANSSLPGKNKSRYIQGLQAEPALSAIPTILLADGNKPGIPDKIKVNLPLDPND